jgi:hypothetical protein
MNVTALYSQTDLYAKSDSTMFPTAEKLAYFNEGQATLNGLIIQQQEDRGESEPTAATTVAGQSDYAETSRIHHINWLKISYDGTNFIPARYTPEQQLISQYGPDYESTLTGWSAAEPMYFYKRDKYFVYPAPTGAQAGVGRLKTSVELLPADLTSGSDTPAIIPATFHYLLAIYAALSWLDADDTLFAKAQKKWDTGIPLMLETMYPRAIQRELLSGVPDEDGSDL